MSSYNYIDSSGSSIQCLFDAGTKIPARVINQYCWIMSTFTLPKHYEGVPGEDMLHFGVGMLYIITENQKLVLPYLQSVTFAIVSRCYIFGRLPFF